MKNLSALLLVLVIVLVVCSSPYFLRQTFPLHYENIIREEAIRHDLDPLFLAAVIQVESSFRLEATSQKGALGLMQIMPDTAFWLGEQRAEPISLEDLFSPQVNIALGSYYLMYLMERFPTEYAALAAYNAGPTNVKRWLDQGIWDGTYLRTGQIPFTETKRYVRKVVMMYNLYTLLYN